MYKTYKIRAIDMKAYTSINDGYYIVNYIIYMFTAAINRDNVILIKALFMK